MRLLSQLSGFFLPLTSVLAGREPLYVYVDEWNYSGQAVADEFIRMAQAGVSHIILAFHLVDNPNFPTEVADSALAWSKVDESIRTDCLNKLHALGTRLLVSSGGESEGAKWLDHDPAEYATKACTLAKGLGFDGFDFDKEGFGFMTAAVSTWTDAAVKKCREVWPGVMITSAPQSPHFSSAVAQKYADGLKNGAGMDHYLIQAYNQGTWTQDTTYDGLFKSSGGMAIKEIMDHYPDAGKDVFVVGKPFNTYDAGSGHVAHSTLREYICKAYTDINYRGGVMFWKHPWGQDISDYTMFAKPCDGSAFTQEAIGGSTPSTPSAQTTQPPATTTTSTTTTPTTTTTTRTVTQAPATDSRTNPAPAAPTQNTPTDSGDAIADCQSHVTSSDSSFTASCQAACELYANSYAKFCPGGAGEAADLVTCVLKQQSKCILACL